MDKNINFDVHNYFPFFVGFRDQVNYVQNPFMRIAADRRSLQFVRNVSTILS